MTRQSLVLLRMGDDVKPGLCFSEVILWLIDAIYYWKSITGGYIHNVYSCVGATWSHEHYRCTAISFHLRM